MLGEGEAGAGGVELYRKYGVSNATYYNWKDKYAGLLARLEGFERN